jgi:RHS repeat-associated protein
VTRHEFTGQEGLDNPGIGLVDMNGRVYNSSGAIFFSPDPYIQDPTNTQNCDRYSYVYNNSLSHVDPSGFAVGDIEGACSGGYFGDDFGGYSIDLGNNTTLCVGGGEYPGLALWTSRDGSGSGGGGGAGGSSSAKPGLPQQTDLALGECLANASAGIGNPATANFNPIVENLSATQAATDSAMQTLTGASAVSVGRAFAGFQPGVPSATNSAFADFGADVQAILRRGAPLVTGAGGVLTVYSIGSSTFSGYQSGGLSGAASGFEYGSGDAILDYSLVDSFGLLGIPLAYAVDKMGGSQTLLSSTEYEFAVQDFLGKAGVMAPPTP